MKKYLIFILFLLLNIEILFSLTGFAESPAFEISDETLPVTLTSFLAAPKINNTILINWTTESESNLIGYHIYRAEANCLTEAIKVTSTIIPASNSQLSHNYSFADDEVQEQVTYYYWLQYLENNTVDFFGPVSAVIEKPDENNEIEELVLGDGLYSNYPNPFNPSTTISYSIDQPSNVTIDIYNIKGQLIKKLYSGYVQTVNTKHSLVWSGTDSQGKQVASGIYFVRLKTSSFTKTRKMLLNK